MLMDLKNVRLAFPTLFTPKAFETGAVPYYSALFPIVPESANHKALKDTIDKVMKEALGPKAKAALAALEAKQRVFFKEAEYLNKEGEPYAGFEGMFYAKASSAQRVVCVDRQGSVVGATDNILYAGCVVIAKVDVWLHQTEKGNRLNGRLLGVQFVKDGEPFGGGVRIRPDSFAALPDEEEELDID